MGSGFENPLAQFTWITSHYSASTGGMIPQVALVREVPVAHGAGVACVALQVNPLGNVRLNHFFLCSIVGQAQRWPVFVFGLLCIDSPLCILQCNTLPPLNDIIMVDHKVLLQKLVLWTARSTKVLT